jgi:hypothetical protein
MLEEESNLSSDAMEILRKLYTTDPIRARLITKSVSISIEFVTIVTTDGMNLMILPTGRDLTTMGLMFPCRISSSIIDSIKSNEMS